MASTMKAVRFHGQKDLRIDDIPVPEVKKGQVKVCVVQKWFYKLKPAWVGICGTDLNEYLDGPTLIPTTPHPITGEKLPLTMGHEFSAIVEEVGEGVTKYKPGDRCVVQPIIYDGTCGACKEGLINCCYQNGFIGLSGWGGGLAEHIVVPESTLYHLPDNISLEIGALVEPLAVGWHAVNISPFEPGKTALILGAGPIGLAVLQALRARNNAAGTTSTIITSEVSRRRKEYAKRFGASHVVDPTKEDVVARCRELCDQVGPHVVFDAAGVQSGFDAAAKAVRARGTIVNIAVWEKPCTFWPNDLVFKERKYLGVATFQAGDFQDVMDAISEGKMKPDEMITSRIQMDEIEKGFKLLIEDKDSQVKVLVEVGSGK